MSSQMENKTRPPLCYFYAAQFSSEVLVGTREKVATETTKAPNCKDRNEVISVQLGDKRIGEKKSS